MLIFFHAKDAVCYIKKNYYIYIYTEKHIILYLLTKY